MFWMLKIKIYPAYISKLNSRVKKHAILLMISVLLREITLKHDDDFHYLNCLHSLRTKKKLESHNKICKKKDFCNVAMTSEETKILSLGV